MDAGTLSESASSNLTELTADIVAAYISHNSVRAEDLAGLINTVHAALGGVSTGSAAPAEAEKRQPAVPVKKSITPDFLVSLFDGKKYKSLKRHLRTSYNMTPEQYREYFNLPRDYPMVAPNYAKARSDLAKSMGLGQQRKKSAGKNAGRRAKKAA
jgi:predicted transcriptional regulator